ncbi:hypothetical protein CYMTET_55880 [Cymbomonas tetramitiformis]|uniref:Protein Asterix n=1 Tax=Cymbomonas tetramitiformis TaxID=36881 RepID=A0AAE0BC19_9CHLO|nr:hypothetical protein CYMTET_55880 [Cymbomonas tetramitiformis]
MSDPRMSSAVSLYKRPVLKEDEIPPDWMALLSLIFGIVGTMAKYKLGAWLSLLCAISSLANIRPKEADTKQIICSCSFAVMSITTNYVAKKASKES